MTARALLALAARAGVTLYRQGDRVRWEATTEPPADLLERLRQHREELARIVPTATPAPVTWHGHGAAVLATDGPWRRIDVDLGDGLGVVLTVHETTLRGAPC